MFQDEYQALQLALTSAETKLRTIQRENEQLVQQLMELKAQDADRMNFENDQFLRRQQQIMQLELAEAAKVDYAGCYGDDDRFTDSGAEECQSGDACWPRRG